MSDEFEGAARNLGGKLEGAVGSVTGDSKTQAQGKVDEVVGQAQQAYGDAKEKVSAAAGDAGARLSDVTSKVGAQASELGGQVYEQGGKAVKYVEDYVREEPVAVMLGVAAIGVLIGYLIGRPPSERAIELGRFRAAYRDR